MRINGDRKLPDNFLRRLQILELSYLSVEDPIRQSGFGGESKRWRAEREPILNAIQSDGDLLDIGCANGYLLECLMLWGWERGVNIIPYGLDMGSGLIDLARKRLHECKDNFYVGNGWNWVPPHKFRFVYSLYDCVPEDYLEEYIYRLLERIVAPGGRLILGAYGSKTQQITPFDIINFVQSVGLSVSGKAIDNDPPVASFVWLDKQ